MPIWRRFMGYSEVKFHADVLFIPWKGVDRGEHRDCVWWPVSRR
jgi:hypothetical protein